MKAEIIVAMAVLFGLPTGAHAQFVKGNEAVVVRPDGSRGIETPPLPAAALATPCPAVKPGCSGGGWKMVETSDGLMECTEIYARPGTCKPSTYGVQKRPRLWVVKSKSTWLLCQYPDLASKCVGTKALPFDAIQ